MARTPSASAHQKVLDAVLRLFASRGIDATSMDAIAKASGVSKATIYKHWADKEALCIDALLQAHGVRELPGFDSGNLFDDLVAFLEHGRSQPNDELRRKLMPHFMAYAARNPEFGVAWRARVMEPPRRRLREILERGIRRGELPPDLDLEVAMALLLGAMMYRWALGTTATSPPRDLPRRVAQAFWSLRMPRLRET